MCWTSFRYLCRLLLRDGFYSSRFMDNSPEHWKHPMLKAFDCNYIRGPKYIEVDVNIGSSAVASGVLRLVLGVITTMVVDMAFLVQANSAEELPVFDWYCSCVSSGAFICYSSHIYNG